MIRTQVIDYMRENASYYKQFIGVHAGGGVRRNPKRKTAGSFSTPLDTSLPSPEELDRVFDSHLVRMAQGGTYGDNLEIVAFSASFGYEVKVYQRDYAYMISAIQDDSSKGVCHIAYHVSFTRPCKTNTVADFALQTWEHYSSIRNLDGPHAGVPNVVVKEITSEEEDKQQKEKLKNALNVPSWQIQLVASSLPYVLDHAIIEQRIQEYKGDANKAINSFFEADEVEEVKSLSSTQESSVDHEVESGDESSAVPSKKQDRRLSRGSKVTVRQREERNRRVTLLKLNQDSKSLESLLNTAASSSGMSDQKTVSLQEADTDEEDWTPLALKDGDTSSNSEYSNVPATKIKLRLPNPSSGASTAVKSSPPKKKIISTRVTKDVQKQALKQAAKERRRLRAIGKHLDDSNIAPASPGMSSDILTLYI